MSSPPLRSPAWTRWLSVLLVVVAVALKLWWHPAPAARAGAAAPASGSAPLAASAPSASAGAIVFGPDIGFHSRERLQDHFHKHGREFHAASAGDYLRLAQALRDRPAGGDVLEMQRGDGVTCRFDRTSGAFLAFDRDGIVRTFFRPNDGERYFERQATRPPDGR